MFVRSQKRRENNRLQNIQKPRTFSKASTSLVVCDPLSPDGPSRISCEPQTELTDLDNSQKSEQHKISVSHKRRSLPVKFVSSSQRKKPEKAFRNWVPFDF